MAQLPRRSPASQGSAGACGTASAGPGVKTAAGVGRAARVRGHGPASANLSTVHRVQTPDADASACLATYSNSHEMWPPEHPSSAFPAPTPRTQPHERTRHPDHLVDVLDGPERPAERPAHVRALAAAVRARQALHPRDRRPMAEKYEALGADRTRRRPLDLRARAAGAAGRRQGPGQEGRPVELLPAQRPDRRGPVQPGLRLHRRRAGQEPAGQRMHELLGPRHRQHGSAGTRRHARAEGASG